MNRFETLKTIFPDLALACDVSPEKITSFGVGLARYTVAEPADEPELIALLQFLHQKEIPFRILSGGTNFACGDEPFEGVLIRLIRGDFTKVSHFHGYLAAGAGARMSELARYGAEHNAGGFAPLAGIPGCVGGSLRMNAGANGDEIGSHVCQVCGVYPDGSPFVAESEQIAWHYRGSSLPDEVIITGAIFRGTACDVQEEKAKIGEEILRRSACEPKGRTAGCAFRNAAPDLGAGMLIDRCGLKKTAVGGVAVSEKHANFIVNESHGSEADCIRLMSHIRQTVAAQWGIYLNPEIVFLSGTAKESVMKACKVPRVLVVNGGNSSERDVSLRSGAAVAEALKQAGYEVERCDIHDCVLPPHAKDFDVIVPALHGGFGENGDFQKVLEDAGMTFVGSDSAASRLIMDKVATKRLLNREKLPTARWCLLSPEKPELPEGIHAPLVLKVPCEGSTVGIEAVMKPGDFAAALEREFKLADVILAEEFIEGVEITVPVILGKAISAVEIHSPHGFYDYDAKYVYKNGHTEYYCPVCNASPACVEKAQRIAEAFYQSSGARDLLRVDFIIGKDGVPYVLEGNSLPGCTETSLVPKAAKADGIPFPQLMANLVQAAFRRRG